MKRNMKKHLKNNKGLASIEATVLLVLFVSLVYYSFGFFGVVHTAILHNIHARTYAFETLRHRTSIAYFRSNRPATLFHYYNTGSRLHGINTDTTTQAQQQVATERPISYGKAVDEFGRRSSVHNRDIYQRIPASGRNTSVEVNPVWIMVFYGVCLNSTCGGG